MNDQLILKCKSAYNTTHTDFQCISFHTKKCNTKFRLKQYRFGKSNKEEQGNGRLARVQLVQTSMLRKQILQETKKMEHIS